KELKKLGNAAGEGLEEESLKDKHWVIATGLAYASDGLVLLTNDGIFAETLASAEGNILSAYDVKIQGDPPVELLHKWRTGAKAGGVRYGRVWCSMTKRTGATSKLRVKYVESPERPIDMLLDAHGMRVQTIRRYAFGP
ncbi:rluB, partial [Symbiodinium sp. CCMP2456]